MITINLLSKTVDIYVLREPGVPFGRARYVGKAAYAHKRYENHLYNLKPQNHKTAWINKLKKQGLKPILQIIETVGIDDWEAAERFWIAWYRRMGARLTNTARGGEGGKALSILCKRGHVLAETSYFKPDGTRQCGLCKKLLDIRRYEKHHEIMKQKQKNYRASNKEKVRARKKTYYEANRDYEKTRSAVYYIAHRDTIREQQKQYRAARVPKDAP